VYNLIDVKNAMSTPYFEGKEVKDIELLDIFPVSEGEITQYYGRIGSGKTYAATADLLELLRRGKVVYANWPISYAGTDERKSIAYSLLGILWPFHKRYFVFPKENLKNFELSDAWARKEGYKDFTDWLSTRTDCEIFADEGHIMFDSYQGIKMSIDKRAAIYHTRHFNRSIHIISQRPTAIHVSMRANVNKFYKCEQIWRFGSIVRFKRTEYQEMANENVDENEEKTIGVKYYWGSKRVFDAYNTHYLRGEMVDSQKASFTAYDMPYFSRWYMLFRNILTWLDNRIKRPPAVVYNRDDEEAQKEQSTKERVQLPRLSNGSYNVLDTKEGA
jgi:hypothetical protein